MTVFFISFTSIETMQNVQGVILRRMSFHRKCVLQHPFSYIGEYQSNPNFPQIYGKSKIAKIDCVENDIFAISKNTMYDYYTMNINVAKLDANVWKSVFNHPNIIVVQWVIYL